MLFLLFLLFLYLGDLDVEAITRTRFLSDVGDLRKRFRLFVERKSFLSPASSIAILMKNHLRDDLETLFRTTFSPSLWYFFFCFKELVWGRKTVGYQVVCFCERAMNFGGQIHTIFRTYFRFGWRFVRHKNVRYGLVFSEL